MTTGSAWLPGKTISSRRPSATWSSSGSPTPSRCSTGKRDFRPDACTAKGYCWINGAPYSLDVRPSTDAPIYATFAELFKVNFASATNSTNAMYGGLACASQQMADWWTQKDKDYRRRRLCLETGPDDRLRGERGRLPLEHAARARDGRRVGSRRARWTRGTCSSCAR